MDMDQAKDVVKEKNYVVFKNNLESPDLSLFADLYKNRVDVWDTLAKNYSNIKIASGSFLENSSVNKFYNKCLEIYGEPNTFYTFEGAANTGSAVHSDSADVIHWQCHGKSEWTLYDDTSKPVKIILEPGDVIWFKQGQRHSTFNLEPKMSLIFMSNEDLKKIIVEKYIQAGLDFE
jgi:beta-galactosidase beta subunit